MEREIQAATSGAAATSEQKTKSAVEGLRGKIKAHLERNRTDFDHRQQEMQNTIVQVSTDLEQLTIQLNKLKPVSKADVGASQSEFTVKVTEKLSVSN